MRKLLMFNHISLDGYFTDAHNDMSFAHNPRPDPEWDEYVKGNASGGGTLVFGRITYEMMASYWPTSFAAQAQPVIAERMNRGVKVVFSHSLERAEWNNTRLVRGDLGDEVRKMKEEPGEDMVILGSGTVVAQLAGLDLIDGYQFVVNPVVLGSGRTLFEGVERKIGLRLARTRMFGNGNVVMWYEVER